MTAKTFLSSLVTPSVFVSVLALCVSSASFYVSYKTSGQENIRVKKEQLRSILTDMINTHKDFRQNLHAGGTPFFDLYTEKRFIYFEAAENIIRQIPGSISWAEYNTLAKQAYFDSKYEKAIEYLQLAHQKATSLQSRVYSLNALAQIHFDDSPLRNYEKGRGYYRQSISELELAKNAELIVIIADTYREWGVLEIKSGFRKEGELLLARSEKYLNDLPPSELPLKKEKLKQLGDLMSGRGGAKRLPQQGVGANRP